MGLNRETPIIAGLTSRGELIDVSYIRHSQRLYLLAAEAFLGKLLVMTGSTVDVVTLGQEALCADWLLAFEAGEAFLVPHFVLVLHVLGP